MSDNGATHFCTHTTDGTICAQCMGTTKGPEPCTLLSPPEETIPWLKWDQNVHGIMCPFQHGDYYLAAPVEAWAKDIKAVLQIIEAGGPRYGTDLWKQYHHDEPWWISRGNQSTSFESWLAQRLLANWPIKE